MAAIATADITLRQAQAADAPALFDAHQDSVLNQAVTAYDAPQLQAWFEGRSPAIYEPALSEGRIWLAERAGRVLGFVGIEPLEVSLLFVRAEAAGSGLGRRLLALGMAQARRTGAGPLKLVATLNSQAFYERHGFVPTERCETLRGSAQSIRIELIRMRQQVMHLCQQPQHTDAVAQLIYQEFWREVKNGMSEADLQAHLRTATDPDRLPLCLIAVDADGQLLGTVNLIDNDDRQRTHLWPWLAAMVVLESQRGRGIGSALVRSLLLEARRLGLPRLFFGTDGPGFYTRLGAQLHEQVSETFCVMRFELG